MLKQNCHLPKLWLKLTGVKFGSHLRLIGYPLIYQFKGSSITIGNDVKINSEFLSNMLGLYQRTIIIARNGGKIEIGNNVGMSGASIYSWKKIKIGDNTIIGANVKIVDNDFHPIDPQGRIDNDNTKVGVKGVEIGENVFIGMNSIILKGSKIGNNCVIGAGSVVSGVFGDNQIIAGNPARVIREIQ